MKMNKLLTLALVLLLSGGANAQEASFTAGSGTAPEGGSGTLSMTMDKAAESAIEAEEAG